MTSTTAATSASKTIELASMSTSDSTKKSGGIRSFLWNKFTRPRGSTKRNEDISYSETKKSNNNRKFLFNLFESNNTTTTTTNNNNNITKNKKNSKSFFSKVKY